MLATVGIMAAKYFGPRALKAVAGAITAGAGSVAVVATQSCDIEAAIGPYLGTAGVALVSYLITYLVPNKGA